MRKFKFLSMAAIAAMMLGACSDDKLSDGPDSPNGPVDNDEGVYFALNIDLPNARSSRSTTIDPGENGSGSASDSGTEIGKDYENAVNEAIVILANANANEFIAAAPVNAGDLNATSADKSSYVAHSKFSKADLTSFYNNLSEEPEGKTLKANIFIFCNPTGELRDYILGNTENNVTAPKQGTNEWVNGIGNLTSSSNIWSKNSFLMTNALIATREIPSTIEQWNLFTDESNPFKLSEVNNIGDGTLIDNKDGRGAIKVERVAARFDFRDASENKDFTYNVVFLKENDVTTEIPLVNIQLQKMALVNLNKTFYYLPHVADPTDEKGTGITSLDNANLLAGVCKPETKWLFDGKGGYNEPFGNYMVDADRIWKNDIYNKWSPNGSGSSEDSEDGTTAAPSSDFDKHFNYPFFQNSGIIDNNNISNDRWATYLCSEVVKGENNNPNGWTAENQDYKIWRYATENTIPSIAGQINGVSTGVVFKGKMIAPQPAEDADENTKALAAAINNTAAGGSYTDPILYAFAGNLYCTWENVRKAAMDAADAQIKFVVDNQQTMEGHWEITEINRENSLYKAVFGTGGMGEFEFTYTDTADNTQKTATIKDEKETDANSANAAWTAWAEDGKKSEGTLKDAFKKAVVGNKFTIYQRSQDPNPKFGWGYYCYYYYWNRHNDNGFNGIMGPMEFAVVRNNVYKLAVTKINRLGHPRISENDPDKPTPGTNDEDESVYIDVTSEVLPWVVRVNNIEF